MKVSIACDRAGIQLKNFIIESLKNEFEFVDFGSNLDEAVDYPIYAKKVVESILAKKTNFGILICGTGIGMSIAANKFKGIRAGLCHNSLEAKLTREHNDANILCLGARIIGQEVAVDNVRVFLNTKFSNEERHRRRIEEIENI